MADNSFVSNALTAMGAVNQDATTGKFYLDGTGVNVPMSKVIAEVLYIKDIFRDGQSVTSKYVAGAPRGGAVRVFLQTPLPFSSRTTGFGGRAGTTGNSGVINKNAPQLNATQDFMVYMNQLNDQQLMFPDIQGEYIPMDIMAKCISQYTDRVTMDRSASTLAEILAYNIWRAMSGADNINTYDSTSDDFLNTLFTALNTKFDNGDIPSGVYTFAQEGRTIIGRPSLINSVLTPKAGILVGGSNLAQEMLNNYEFNPDRSLNDASYVGSNYKGNLLGFNLVSAPDYIWTLAEQYLELAAGSLSAVMGVAVSFEATATATNVDLGVKVIDSQDARGLLAQPLNIWGHESFRKSQIIGTTGLSTTTFSNLGFTDSNRKYPVAPQALNDSDTIDVPITDATGAIIGYKRIASVPTPNGGGIEANPEQVATPTATTTNVNSVTLASTTAGATIYYTINGKTPTVTTGTVYSAAITNAAGTTLKAIAVADGYANSAVLTVAVASS